MVFGGASGGRLTPPANAMRPPSVSIDQVRAGNRLRPIVDHRADGTQFLYMRVSTAARRGGDGWAVIKGHARRKARSRGGGGPTKVPGT